MENINKEIIEELNEVSAKNASRSMRVSRKLFLTKNGKPFSDESDAYATKLKEYRAYCKEDSRNLWNTHKLIN